MAFRSAWSRGLAYGGVFGGAIALIPLLAWAIGSAPFTEVDFATGMIVLLWGGLGFLAGFASHSEQRPDGTLPSTEVSSLSRLVYRFVAGLLLGYVAGMLVCAIGLGLFFVWQSTNPNPPNRADRDAERQLAFVVFCGFIGAETGAVAGCWIGAMLVRGANILGPIARAALVTSMYATLAGGWLGALIGLACFHVMGFNEAGAIAAAIAGSLAGILTAGVSRLAVIREPKS